MLSDVEACGEMLAGVSQSALSANSAEELASLLGGSWRSGYIGPGEIDSLMGTGPWGAELFVGGPVPHQPCRRRYELSDDKGRFLRCVVGDWSVQRMSWLVEMLEVVEGGVLVRGVFDGDRLTLRFNVSNGASGIVAVARPPELRDVPIAPGGREQSVLELIRFFHECSRVS